MFSISFRGASVKRTIIVVLACLPITSFAESRLSLAHALAAIKQNDYRLKQFQAESEAYLSASRAAEYLPDPTLFTSIQSLPTDTFEFDQEPMTQLRVGVRQMFPKGETLAIQSELAVLQSDVQSHAQRARWLNQKKAGEQAWLETWFWQKKLALLEDDKVFLNQVADFIRSLYEVGAKDQSDLLGAELELLKLEEKVINASRQFASNVQELNRLANTDLGSRPLSIDLPSLAVDGLEYDADSKIAQHLSSHPKIELLNQQVNLAKKKVELVDQDLEPAWGVEVSYGLRDGENMDGSDRADFFSAGVSVQLPLFSKNKQHHNQSAAKQRASAVRLKRDEVLNELRFQYQKIQSQYQHTREQRMLYERDILPTLVKQKQSALQAYEADQGNFHSVIALFLKEQSAKSMHQRLRVNEQKYLSSLNFLLGRDAFHPAIQATHSISQNISGAN